MYLVRGRTKRGMIILKRLKDRQIDTTHTHTKQVTESWPHYKTLCWTIIILFKETESETDGQTDRQTDVP